MQHFSSVHETATEDVMNLNPGFSGSVHHDCFHYPVIYAMPYYPSFLVDIWGCQGRNVGIFLVPSKVRWFPNSVQFSSIIQLCPTLCDPMDCSTPGLPVHHQLPEFTQTHVHWVSDAIQPSYPLSSPSPPTLNLSQHQGLFKWVSSSYQMAKYWSFSFNISPSNDYSGLLSFRMDWNGWI